MLCLLLLLLFLLLLLLLLLMPEMSLTERGGQRGRLQQVLPADPPPHGRNGKDRIWKVVHLRVANGRDESLRQQRHVYV